MNRLIAALIVPALALMPATALAHSSKKSRGKVYTGTLKLAGGDGDYVRGGFGRVQLVDNGRRDTLLVQAKRAAKRVKYTYRLQTGTCATTGTDVAGWRYRTLRTNRRGNGASVSHSRTFSATRGTRYRVVISVPGQAGLCAQLTTKYWRGKSKHRGHDKPKPQAKSNHRGHSKPAPRHVKPTPTVSPTPTPTQPSSDDRGGEQRRGRDDGRRSGRNDSSRSGRDDGRGHGGRRPR